MTSPSAVPAPHSAQSASTAARSPIHSRPSSSVPAPTVISAIAGAPQNCAITGLFAYARARWGYRVQCTAQAAVSRTRKAAASAHTASANACSPGTWNGSVAAAIATIPVPMIAANQFGPRSRKTSPGRSRSFSIPNGRGWLRWATALSPAAGGSSVIMSSRMRGGRRPR